MIITDDGSSSPWQMLPQPLTEALDRDIATEVCVIGAGVVGLTTAFLLQQRGRRVIVIDDGEVGGRQTVRSTAHITTACDDRFFKIIRTHGLAVARKVASSHLAAIDIYRQIVSDETLDCDFEIRDGYLILGPDQKIDYLQKELQACFDVGLHAVEWIPNLTVARSEMGPSLRFPGCAQIHPGRYAIELARRLIDRGVEIFTHTRAVKVEDGSPTVVITKNGNLIKSESVVVATNVPVNTVFEIHLKEAAYRTYVMAFAIQEDQFPDILLWDTANPYHYVRKHRIDDQDFLIVGGEDHKTGQVENSDAVYQRLQAWTHSRFPFIGNVAFRWSGQIIEPVDGLPYIGALSETNKIFICAGDSGQGMTYGAVAARLISDLICGQTNPWTSVFSPERISLLSAPTFLRENINTATQYLDWLSGSQVISVDHIACGSGAVIRNGITKIAVYRDEEGQLHPRSAICTHLGGIVHWNSQEKTWDCPCHGSRFSALGKVINGPAVQDLPLTSINEPSLPPPSVSAVEIAPALEADLS